MLDVDQALRFIAVSAVILHLDNYIGIGHNNYLYEVDGKFTVIPWDTNMAFGTFNLGIRKDGIINFYIDEPTAGPVKRYPLVYKLLSHPPYLERYRNYVKAIIDGPFNPDVILPRIDRLVELVRPYAKADTEMFYSYEDWERCLTEDLRPPDLFEGWMAGGPSPTLPFFLSPQESMKLRSNFKVNSLYELINLDFTPEKLELLRNCLLSKNYDLFLQNYYGPLKSPQPPRQPGFGPNSLGLKTFIKARYESVRQQLAGERSFRFRKMGGERGQHVDGGLDEPAEIKYFKREENGININGALIKTAVKAPPAQRFERKFTVVPMKTGFALALLRQVCRADKDYPARPRQQPVLRYPRPRPIPAFGFRRIQKEQGTHPLVRLRY